MHNRVHSWKLLVKAAFLTVTTRKQIMEDVKQKLSSGEFKTVVKEGKSTVWNFFFLVVQADSNDAVGYVKCKKVWRFNDVRQ